ncbi:unnamed protein product [Brachionus calyciflorus]|uniref:non-specific serine/threonine protein kinase n=1 Tax=Brachionus calyciflorus TaxID=104777 RepID=A0A813V7E6_9BILA|nr:unnamed protein product [Brachionus calyciflorus]
MDDFNRSNSTPNIPGHNDIYSFYNQNNYQFLPPPPPPPPPPPSSVPTQQNLSYYTYQSTPAPVVYQYSNYQNTSSFLNSSLNSSNNYYQTSNSYIPNYQNYYSYPSSPAKTTNHKIEENQIKNDNLVDLGSEVNTSLKRSSAVLPMPKYIRPKICKSPLVIQSVQSKKVVKPTVQQATIPPENVRRIAEDLPEYVKKINRSQPPPPPPSYETSLTGKKLTPPSTLPPPPPSIPPQIFHHPKIHKNLLNQVLENSFNSEKTNNSRNNYDFEGSFNTSGNNNSVFNHTGIQDENLQNYQFFIQSNLYTFFDRKKQPPPPPYPGNKIEEMDVQQNLQPPPPPTIPPPPPPIPYEQAIFELEQQRLKNSNLSSNSSQTSTNFSSIRQCSPQAFKFFMEQHAENVLKHHKARESRRLQLENEMKKLGLSNEERDQLRKLLRIKETNYLRLRRAKMNKSMFEHIKTLGIGAFGQVDLVRKKDDPQRLYAMKILHKSDVFNRNQAAHVKAERDILAEADNEWVVKLYYSFQDDENLYFVMDYVPGGDLMNLLIKKGVFSENLARFYIGELTCAIESVHNLGFIHRDIKPDNILIDYNGHIKLTDFGLCTGFHWTHNTQNYIIDDTPNRTLDKKINKLQKNVERRLMAHSLVGTPNYIAPEILSRKGYTKSCDWWSVGVILYEMIVGEPPFRDETALGTQAKVINWRNTLRIPDGVKISIEAKDLIFKLCTDAETRLNADGIKAHQFFKGFDFGPDLRKTEALFKPTIKHALDTSNFEPIDAEIIADRKARIEQMNRNRQLQSQNMNNGYSNIYKKPGDNSDGNQNGSSNNNPVLYEFTFRRFFDEGSDLKFLTGALDEYSNDNSFKSFIQNISSNRNSLKSVSEKMDYVNTENIINPQNERNLSPSLTSMMASVTTSCKTLNEENCQPQTDTISKTQLKESTNFNSYNPTTESLNENSIQLGKENNVASSSSATNKPPIYI